MSRRTLIALSAVVAAFFLVVTGGVATLAFRNGSGAEGTGAAAIDPAVAAAPPEVPADVVPLPPADGPERADREEERDDDGERPARERDHDGEDDDEHHARREHRGGERRIERGQLALQEERGEDRDD